MSRQSLWILCLFEKYIFKNSKAAFLILSLKKLLSLLAKYFGVIDCSEASFSPDKSFAIDRNLWQLLGTRGHNNLPTKHSDLMTSHYRCLWSSVILMKQNSLPVCSFIHSFCAFASFRRSNC